jgi:transcriptional regulator NrdR family protein
MKGGDYPLNCTNCGSDETRVIATRKFDSAVQRTRFCQKCLHSFTTWETPDQPGQEIITQNGKPPPQIKKEKEAGKEAKDDSKDKFLKSARKRKAKTTSGA